MSELCLTTQELLRLMRADGFLINKGKAHAHFGKAFFEEEGENFLFLIKPLAEGGFIHAVVFEAEPAFPEIHENDRVTALAYTLAGDDILFGLKTWWKSVSYIDAVGSYESLMTLIEKPLGERKHVSTYPFYVPARFRQGRDKAIARANLMMILDKVPFLKRLIFGRNPAP